MPGKPLTMGVPPPPTNLSLVVPGVIEDEGHSELADFNTNTHSYSPFTRNKSIDPKLKQQYGSGYTTGRRQIHVACNTIGTNLSLTQRPATAAATYGYGPKMQSDTQPFLQQPTLPLHPHSARVSRAAERAYGKPNSKTGNQDWLNRKSFQVARPFVGVSSSVIGSVRGQRPGSAILGGGFSRPLSHHLQEKSPRKKAQSAQYHQSHSFQEQYEPHSYQAGLDAPLMSGALMFDSPAFERPMSAGPTVGGDHTFHRTMFHASCYQDENGQEQRLPHTLPTDPLAQRTWDQLARKSSFKPPQFDAPPAARPKSAIPPASDSIRRRLSKCLNSERGARINSERFTSSSVSQHMYLMADSQPKAVTGYSLPIREYCVPHANNEWWAGSTRLGKSTIRKIDANIKMTEESVFMATADKETKRNRINVGEKLMDLKGMARPLSDSSALYEGYDAAAAQLVINEGMRFNASQGTVNNGKGAQAHYPQVGQGQGEFGVQESEMEGEQPGAEHSQQQQQQQQEEGEGLLISNYQQEAPS